MAAASSMHRRYHPQDTSKGASNGDSEKVKVHQRIVSSPYALVTVTSIAIIILTSIAYCILDSEHHIGNSLAFGVTLSAFFVALMIFRIQTYSTLAIHLQIASFPDNMTIALQLVLDNQSSSKFKGNISVDESFLYSNFGESVDTVNNKDVKKLAVEVYAQKAPVIVDIAVLRMKAGNAGSMNFWPRIGVIIEADGLLKRNIVGRHSISFPYAEIQDKFNEVYQKIVKGEQLTEMIQPIRVVRS